MPNATYRYDVHKAFQIFFDPTYGLMHYLSKNLVSSFNPSVLHVNVVYDLPVCLAAMQAGRGESQPENAKGNGHFSRNPSSPYDAIPTLLIVLLLIPKAQTQWAHQNLRMMSVSGQRVQKGQINILQ